MSFLELKVSLTKGKLSTNLHIKPTDCCRYLHFSGDPDYTNRSIIYSRQLLRVSRICSGKNDFNRQKSDMKMWFEKWGYSKNIIENEIKNSIFLLITSFKEIQVRVYILFVGIYYHPERVLHRHHYLLNKNALAE